MSRGVGRRLLICSFAAPTPTFQHFGYWNVQQAQGFVAAGGGDGSAAAIFRPTPAVPPWVDAAAGRWRRNRSGLPPPKYAVQGIDVHATPVRFFYFPWVQRRLTPAAPAAVGDVFSRAVRPALRRVVDEVRPTDVLFHGVMPWGEVAADVCRPAGLRFGFIEHGVEEVRRALGHRRLARWYRGHLAGSVGVACVGRRMCDDLAARVGDAAVYLPNGATITEGTPDRPAAWGDDFVVACVGAYYPRKGHALLVEAFARLVRVGAKTRLIVVGDMPATIRDAARPLGSAVTFTGNLPHAEALKMMAAADFFALPSWDEAFGVVYLEAMGAAKVVLMCGDCGLAGDVVPPDSPVLPSDNPVAYVVPPGDAAAVHGALADALRLRNDLPRLGEHNRRVVGGHYTWAANGRRLRAFLDRPVPA